MTDYKTMNSFGDYNLNLKLKRQDKGHLQELIEFYNTLVSNNKKLPIELDSMIQTTISTFLIIIKNLIKIFTLEKKYES